MTKQRTAQPPEQLVADSLAKEQQIVEIVGGIRTALQDGVRR